jgi:hydroxyethylthiazole kinase-like uncharacterized protein yjeF
MIRSKNIRDPSIDRAARLETLIVTAAQMQAIEARVFEAGMPVAALMEKVAGVMVRWLRDQYPLCRVGVLVGPGHNGGDALVVARELSLLGYEVQVHCPFGRLKPLTTQHHQYVRSLGVPISDQGDSLGDCDVWVDGLFGFGLDRSVEGTLAALIQELNSRSQPIVSIDLPSGIHTDSGAVLGTAIRATQTLCLGLWKQAFVQETALPYLGVPTLIDFGLPLADIQAVLGETPVVQRLSPQAAIATLPLSRDLNVHKYRVGHLLVIAGSRQYAGAAGYVERGHGQRGRDADPSGSGIFAVSIGESFAGSTGGGLPGNPPGHH